MSIQATAAAEAASYRTSIPWSWYVDPESYELEKSAILHRSWHYVGHVAQLEEEGAFITAEIAGRLILIVRGGGELRAFANVCRHRGAELIGDREGCRKALTCRYHAWSWNVDGTLRAAPSTAGIPDADWPLLPLPLATWGPLVFASPGDEVVPFDEAVGDLRKIVLEQYPDFEQFRHHAQLRYSVDANWKVFIDNFNECYHCPVAHQTTFARVVDTGSSYTTRTDWPYSSVQTGVLRDNSDQIALFGYLWPTFGFAVSSVRGAFTAITAHPTGPETCDVTYDFFFGPDSDEATRQRAMEFTEIVNAEDLELYRFTQLGLRSGALADGPLVMARESGVAHFQDLVRQFRRRAASSGI